MKYEQVSPLQATASHAYAVESLDTLAIREDLRPRLEEAGFPVEALKAVEAYKGQEITGCDVLVCGGKIYRFKQLVGFDQALGQGWLCDTATGDFIEDTPVIDYDWQDEEFDYCVAAMQRFMSIKNK